MDRLKGYYWVYDCDKWHVAYWDGQWWWFCGSDQETENAHIDVVDEKRIPDHGTTP